MFRDEKTVVLFQEAVKAPLLLGRLGAAGASGAAAVLERSSEAPSVSRCSRKRRLFNARNWQETEDFSQRCAQHHPSKPRCLSQDTKRSWKPPCRTVQGDRNTRISYRPPCITVQGYRNTRISYRPPYITVQVDKNTRISYRPPCITVQGDNNTRISYRPQYIQ